MCVVVKNVSFFTVKRATAKAAGRRVLLPLLMIVGARKWSTNKRKQNIF